MSSIDTDHIKVCVAHYFRYKRQCKLIATERSIRRSGWYRPDILVVTKDRRLIEVEVKTSIVDFKADAKKHIWKMRDRGGAEMPYQFYYAVPANLADKVKPLLRSDCGLIRVEDFYKQDWANNVRVIKNAPINKQSKRLSLQELVEMVKNQTGTICSMMLENYKAQLKKERDTGDPVDQDMLMRSAVEMEATR